jgi:ABC-type phosphate transport system substrate-binding protein
VLADVFLRRATRWSDGGPIQVVDQSLKSEVRVEFTEEVLELTSMAVMSYWQQQLLRGGERPPAVKPSDAEVLEFVAKTRGAIGYVLRGFQVAIFGGHAGNGHRVSGV